MFSNEEITISINNFNGNIQTEVYDFIGNRLQHALWREAISLVENGVCDAASVDTVIKSSFGRRLSVLGPLENADLVGTDLTLDGFKTPNIYTISKNEKIPRPPQEQSRSKVV